MTISVTEAQRSVDQYLERVRSWRWSEPPTAPAKSGVIQARSEWMASLEASTWQQLRYRWRNEYDGALDKLQFPNDDWNALNGQVRDAVKTWLAEQLAGEGTGRRVVDSVAWDLILGWQATCLRRVLQTPYLQLLELYESGWLVGGQLNNNAPTTLAIIEASVFTRKLDFSADCGQSTVHSSEHQRPS